LSSVQSPLQRVAPHTNGEHGLRVGVGQLPDPLQPALSVAMFDVASQLSLRQMVVSAG
jgi:hypothetical protein